MAACAGQIAFSDTGYRLFCMVRTQLAGWSLSSQTTVSEKRLGFFWLVVVALDQMRPPSSAPGGFEAPLNELADMLLVFEDVKRFRWVGRCPVRIERSTI